MLCTLCCSDEMQCSPHRQRRQFYIVCTMLFDLTFNAIVSHSLNAECWMLNVFNVFRRKIKICLMIFLRLKMHRRYFKLNLEALNRDVYIFWILNPESQVPHLKNRISLQQKLSKCLLFILFICPQKLNEHQLAG